MLRKSSLLHAFGTKYVQNHYFECKYYENLHFKMHLAPHMYKTGYFEGKCLGNHYFKMHLAPNMYKIVNLKANGKEIITSKCI